VGPGNPAVAGTPPAFFNSTFDWNGDGTINSTTDDDWFYKELTGRVNLTEIQASALLRKPSGNHHFGGRQFDITDSSSGGGLSKYSVLYNWILAGMPAGGVVANIVANSAPTVTFTGGPPGTATIALDGSTSISAATYAWSILSGPAGASIQAPGAATTNLVVQNVSTVGNPYVVQLTANNGSDTDTVTKQIVVSETPLAFNVSVVGLSGGTVLVPFSGPSLTGTITVNATQNAGNPMSCVWQVTPVTPGVTGVTVGTNSCSTATLNVSSVANTKTFSVTLTEQNVSLPAVQVSQTFTVGASSGNPSGADFTFPASNIGFTINGSLLNAPVARINGITTNNVTLTGGATGPGTLNFTWSLPSGVGTAGCSIASPGPSSSPTVSLRVSKAGTCSVTLTVSNGIPPNSTTTKTVTIGSSVVFSTVASIVSSATCTVCHTSPGNATVPSLVNDGGLFTRLTTEPNVVLTGTPQSSRLLVCPSVGCNTMLGNRATFSGADFSGYDSVLTWITNGATP
jgi:hypothetical protein